MDLSTLSDHIVLIGWDKFSRLVAGELLKAEQSVLVITPDAHEAERINSDKQTQALMQALCSDYEDFEKLRPARIEHSQVVFINLPSDREKLIYLVKLRREFPDAKIVSPVSNANLKETFINAADVHPLSKDEVSAKIFASYLFEQDVATLLGELLSPAVTDEDNDIQQYRVIETNPFIGKPYGEAFAKLKIEHNVVLLGMSKRQEKGYRLLKNPPDNTLITKGDYLIMLMNGKAAATLEELFGVEEGA